MQPSERAPVGIPDFKKSNRQKQKERGESDQCRGYRGGAVIADLGFGIWDFRRRPVLPAQPEKTRSEEWDQPAIAVLLADRPLVAQLPAEDKPKRADGADNQRSASETAVASRGYGLRLRENGIQSALIISHEPKDESALQKRL